MQALARLAARRPVAVSVVAAALVILGWTSWNNLPLDLLPDLQTPTIVVSIRSGDRPPAEMERIYGEQVEQRLCFFSRRDIRDATGWSQMQIRRHLDRLVELEYVHLRSGRNGTVMQYELLTDVGEENIGYHVGLIDVKKLRRKKTKAQK